MRSYWPFCSHFEFFCLNTEEISSLTQVSIISFLLTISQFRADNDSVWRFILDFLDDNSNLPTTKDWNKNWLERNKVKTVIYQEFVITEVLYAVKYQLNMLATWNRKSSLLWKNKKIRVVKNEDYVYWNNYWVKIFFIIIFYDMCLNIACNHEVVLTWSYIIITLK